jgi:hypothetical protein
VEESLLMVASIYRTELVIGISLEILPGSPEEKIVVMRLTKIEIETFKEQIFERQPFTRPLMFNCQNQFPLN